MNDFVETDEKVRVELDRKQHVEYLKAKISSELENSAKKVRNSRSPVRRQSPYRSKDEYE